MDLSTKYLGFTLPHPFVVGSSPLVDSLDKVKQLAEAGAAAIVMHSLFEEQLLMYQKGLEKHIDSHEESFGEATTYFPRMEEYRLGPEQYLEQIKKIKKAVKCPVIASLNGTHEGAWVDYAKMMQEAGADALELNLYFLPASKDETSAEVEERSLRVVRVVRQAVSIPLAVKISPFFTSLMSFANKLADAGADGLVLFNRFYQPDIDIEKLETVPTLHFSDSSELLLRLRWLAMLHKRVKLDHVVGQWKRDFLSKASTLHKQVNLDLAVTGGVHTKEDAIKTLMAGADAVQLVSVLLQKGPQYLQTMRDDVAAWMQKHDYKSLAQLKGSMSHLKTPNPDAVERANYLKILQSWKA